MNDKQFIFGAGTGRCGTVSLCKLLNAQKGADITHEDKPWLPWIRDERLVKQKVLKLKNKQADIVGDVALFNLQSIEFIIKLLPYAKFVVLKRNKEQTVDSFMRKWKPKYNRIACKRTEWDYVFPNYRDTSIEKAVKKYYDKYYSKVFKLEKRYSANVNCYDTQMLNSYDGIRNILFFCGVPEERQVIKIGIKANEGNRI